MTKNRAKHARERAGLSVEQAAHLLDLPSFGVVSIEEHDPDFDKADHANLADVYGVNVEWLRGDKPLRDYEAMKDAKGWNDISQHDRDVVAEFAASLPPPKCKHLPGRCAKCGRQACLNCRAIIIPRSDWEKTTAVLGDCRVCNPKEDK